MESQKEQSIPHLNITKHCLTADYYANVCPAISRFSMTRVSQIKAIEDIVPTPVYISCQFCGSVYRPGNHKDKILPKMKLSPKIQKLQRKVAVKGEQSLGKFQRKLLENFDKSRTKVVITCDCCQKKTVIPCPTKPVKINVQQECTPVKKQSKKKLKQKRRRKKLEEDLHGVLSRPTFAAKTTPSKTIEPASKTVLSRSGQSVIKNSTVDSFKSKKKAKSKDMHQTLQRILQKEKKQSDLPKSSLQSFLSSL